MVWLTPSLSQTQSLTGSLIHTHRMSTSLKKKHTHVHWQSTQRRTENKDTHPLTYAFWGPNLYREGIFMESLVEISRSRIANKTTGHEVKRILYILRSQLSYKLCMHACVVLVICTCEMHRSHSRYKPFQSIRWKERTRIVSYTRQCSYRKSTEWVWKSVDRNSARAREAVVPEI